MTCRPGRLNGPVGAADTQMVDQHPELTRGQRRLLSAYRRWGPTVLIVAITVCSVLLAVGTTTVVLVLQRAKALDWLVALSESIVIPLIVAPLTSGATVRFAGALVAAHDQMEVMAGTDPLTGLANRRRFFAVAARMLADRAPDDVVLVAVTDIDAFKQVNDAHGHAVGDAVLRQLGRQLATAVEGHGMAARFGGDEFACILRVPAGRADTVRAAVGDACREVDFGGEVHLSASVGFGEVGAPDDVDGALARADVELYMAKSVSSARSVRAA
ncbi:MAG: GGDEF domain-containing protein [Thermoleophilia bacterium]